MEKETLLTGFKNVLGEPAADGYIGDTGVTMRTLEKYVDALLPTITSDDMVNEQFYQSQSEVVKAMGGQMRFEKAEFAKNYKPTGGKNTPPTTPPAGDNDNKELIKRLERLENERKEEQMQMAVKGLRLDVKGKAEELHISNKALWNDAVDMVEFKDKMGLDEMTNAAKTIYEKKLKDYFGSGAVPYGGMAGAGAPTVSETEAKAKREAFRNRMQSQGRLPKKVKHD